MSSWDTGEQRNHPIAAGTPFGGMIVQPLNGIPDLLGDKCLAQKNAASMEQTKALRATLAAVDKRLAELEKLVVSAYEDKVKDFLARIPHQPFVR